MYLAILIAWLYVHPCGWLLPNLPARRALVMGAVITFATLYGLAAHGHRATSWAIIWRKRVLACPWRHGRTRGAGRRRRPVSRARCRWPVRLLPPRALLSRRRAKRTVTAATRCTSRGCRHCRTPAQCPVPADAGAPALPGWLKLAWCVFTEILRCSSISRAQKASHTSGLHLKSLRADASAQPGECLTGVRGRY